MPGKARIKTSTGHVTPVLNPDAASIDIDATTIYAVPGDRDPEPVRSFGAFLRQPPNDNLATERRTWSES